MEVVKLICRTVKRSKCLQITLILGLFCAIYLYYAFGSRTKITGLDDSVKISKDTENNKNIQNHENDAEPVLSVSHSEINVMITFTKAENNYNLQDKFRTTVKSLLRFASVPVNLYILGDAASEAIAKTTLQLVQEVAPDGNYRVLHLDIDSLAKQVHEIVSEMQKYFSYAPGAYYSDSLFFLSLVSHKVLPGLHKVIMLDCDLKFDADIADLYKHFEEFSAENIIGIAHDGQPVYRHNLHMYRNKHPDTRAGSPPPDGLAGFNSGVLLLDLYRMRKSKVYNSLLAAEAIQSLTEKYMFKGHLGDQDFYSLISLDHEELFYTLPCTWNRQLCTWWRDHGYLQVFEEYFKCEGHINIYHGNCNTAIPTLDWETSS